MPSRGTTSDLTASVAARVLRDKNSSKAARSAAASALTQKAGSRDRSASEVTSKSVASSAAKVLRDPRASAAEKAAAASALVQRRRTRRRK